MTIKAKCSQCGEEVKLDDKWQGFIDKYPDKVKCYACKTGKTTTKSDDTSVQANKYANKSSNSKAWGSSSKSKANISSGGITAQHFKEYFIKVREVFTDEEWEEVKDYAGGWTTTLILQADKKGELK